MVVRCAGAIVATGTIVPRDPSTAEILRMSVAAGHRRVGLGRLVVEELLTTAQDWGTTAVLLETSAHWHEVVSFYQSCGFAIHPPRGRLVRSRHMVPSGALRSDRPAPARRVGGAPEAPIGGADG